MRFTTAITILFTALALPVFAQKSMPSIDVKTLDGQSVNIQNYTKEGKITVISFWATWCKPCQQELDNISELYPEWQEKYGVQFLAITIDTQRALAKVGPLVESKGWDYTILTDANQALKNAMNFQAIPQTFLVDQKGNIVYEHSGYVPGNEFELEEKIAALAEKK